MAEYNGSIELISGIKPKNNGDFPLVDAKDVQMPDGSRLSNLTTNYPLADGVTELQPDKYYVFGEVDSLNVSLVEVNDGKVHEYCFEFTASENFTEFTVTPTPKWASANEIAAGKMHQVSILRGIGVLINA